MRAFALPMSTPTTSPLASTITPAVAPLSSVSAFFTAPTTEADESDVRLALAGGATAEQLGIEAAPDLTKTPTKENAASVQPGGEAGAAGAPAAATNETPAGAGDGTGAKAAEETPEAKIARMEKEIADLKAGKKPEETTAAAAPVEIPALTAPIAGQPLALVSSERDFAFLEQTAERVKQWGYTNAQGGEMPADLRTAMEAANKILNGRESKMAVSDFLDPEGVGHFRAAAEDMLKQIPQRRNFLAAETKYLADVREKSPAYFDAKKPEGQLFQRILLNYPILRSVPEWACLVRDLAAGFLQNQAAAKGAEGKGKTEEGKSGEAALTLVKTTEGGAVPLAPGAAIGGAASASPGGVTQRQLDEAEARMNDGKATQADWVLLTAHAA